MRVLTRVSEEVVMHLSGTMRAVRSSGRHLDHDRITPATAFLLSRLEAGDGFRCGELAEAVGVDASVISRQLSELVRLGLSERRPDPHDGRAWLACITPAGGRLLEEYRVRHLRVVDAALSTWDDVDVAVLTELLARLERDVLAYAHEAAGPHDHTDHEKSGVTDVRQEVSAMSERAQRDRQMAQPAQAHVERSEAGA